jgi:Bacteriophage baseplate protein W
MKLINSEYSDIDYLLRIDTSQNPIIVKDEDSIRQSIKSILSTYPGERIMLPEFGSTLKRLLFEPMSQSTADTIETEIETAIRRWENRAYISSVDVIANEDNNNYEISINFIIIITGQAGNFTGFVSVQQ